MDRLLFFIHRLLLRDLPSHVNSTRRKTLIHTRLIVADGVLEFLDDSRHLFAILALIYKPGRSPFRLQPLQSLLDRFQCAERPSTRVDRLSDRRAYLNNSERRFFPPWFSSTTTTLAFCLNQSKRRISSSTLSSTSSDCCDLPRQLCTIA